MRLFVPCEHLTEDFQIERNPVYVDLPFLIIKSVLLASFDRPNQMSGNISAGTYGHEGLQQRLPSFNMCQCHL